MTPLSVFIIAKNEAARIGRAIESVRTIASEIIVIDSGSQDNTVAISEQLGAKVIFNPWSGYVEQKIFGEKQCVHDWILNIDADEEISPALASEIINALSSAQSQAYTMDIVMVHRFDKAPRKFAPYNTCLRLYNRHFANFAFRDQASLYHDTVRPFPGTQVAKLRAQVWHHSVTSLEQALSKINFYTSTQAKEMLANNRKPHRMRLITEFFISFIKAYFLRRYCIYGITGFADSMMFAFARYLRLAKAYEEFKKLK